MNEKVCRCVLLMKNYQKYWNPGSDVNSQSFTSLPKHLGNWRTSPVIVIICVWTWPILRKKNLSQSLTWIPASSRNVYKRRNTDIQIIIFRRVGGLWTLWEGSSWFYTLSVKDFGSVIASEGELQRPGVLVRLIVSCAFSSATINN